MSRNLCGTACAWCGCEEVETVGPDHAITPQEAGYYFNEYQGMIVADAECRVCGAKYLAWVDDRQRVSGGRCDSRSRYFDGDQAFFDLSFRSTFNDEPGETDGGIPNVREELRRLREYVVQRGATVTTDRDWQRETLAVFARTGDEFSYLKNLQWYLRIPFEEAQRRAWALERSGYLESRPEKFGPTFRISESGRKFLEGGGE